MNFNQTLDSFRPQLDLTMHVIRLANDCNSTRPVRIFFSSSVAVVGRYPLTHGLRQPIEETSEITTDDVEHFGYAEAKWACERLYTSARNGLASRLTATNIRFGQLSGVEATGFWNENEHLPMIVKSCQAVGKVPILPGVSSARALCHRFR